MSEMLMPPLPGRPNTKSQVNQTMVTMQTGYKMYVYDMCLYYHKLGTLQAHKKGSKKLGQKFAVTGRRFKYDHTAACKSSYIMVPYRFQSKG